MSNQNEFQYIEAKQFLHLPVIEISDVKSFTRFANANNITYIFKITGNNENEFFFVAANIVYKINGGRFQTLSELQQAKNGYFIDATEYEEAKKLNISTREELLDYKKGSDYNKEEYDEAIKAGFKDGFEKFKSNYDKYMHGKNTSVIPAGIDSFMKLYKYASEKELKTYKDFEKVYDAEFPNHFTWNDAQTKGYKDAKSYFDGTRRGFSNPEEYAEAIKLSIENKKEYDEFNHLRHESKHREMSFDEMQLLVAISNCENGKLISVAEARKLLQSEQEKILKWAGLEGKKFLPLWYKKSIEKDAEMIKFMKTNKELRMFGFFNTGKNSFEVFKLSAQKILIDGSNVAYNAKSKPDIKNIRAVIKELQFYGFTDIIILVDASLRHYLKNPLELDDLKKEYNCHEAPSKSSADEFLIDLVKREKCKIITNDEFKDWKKKDKWVNDKIDDICVKFRVVSDDIAILRDIEKFVEKPVDPQLRVIN